MYLDKEIDKDLYKEKQREIHNRKTDLLIQLQNHKYLNPDKLFHALEQVLLFSCSLEEMFLEGNNLVRVDILSSLLWNFEINNKQVASASYKMPYKLLENLNKTTDLSVWRRGRDSNSREPRSSAGFQDQSFQPLRHLSKLVEILKCKI